MPALSGVSGPEKYAAGGSSLSLLPRMATQHQIYQQLCRHTATRAVRITKEWARVMCRGLLRADPVMSLGGALRVLAIWRTRRGAVGDAAGREA